MKMLLLGLLLSCVYPTHAQGYFNNNKKYAPEEWYFLFTLGATYSSFDNIRSMLIPPAFSESTYQTQVNPRWGFRGGVALYYRFPKSSLAIQPEVTYSMEGSDFAYDDILDLKQWLAFKYQYVNVGCIIKIYPLRDLGLHVGLGPQLGFNIMRTNIDYTSNKPEYGLDLQFTQNMRDVIKGQTNFSVGFRLGYEFDFGLNLELGYNHGISDVVETMANGYYFTEKHNKNATLFMAVGFAIPID